MDLKKNKKMNHYIHDHKTQQNKKYIPQQIITKKYKIFFLDKNGTIKNKCVLKIVKTIGNVKILQFSSSSSSLFSIILS